MLSCKLGAERVLCVAAWIQNRETSSRSQVTLLKLTFGARSMEIVMERSQAWVRGSEVSDSDSLVLPRDAWTYVGVTWRRSDGRLLMRVLYDDDTVEQVSTLGFSSGLSLSVSYLSS